MPQLLLGQVIPCHFVRLSRGFLGSFLFLQPTDAAMESLISDLWHQKCQHLYWGPLRVMRSIHPIFLLPDLFHFFFLQKTMLPLYTKRFSIHFDINLTSFKVYFSAGYPLSPHKLPSSFSSVASLPVGLDHVIGSCVWISQVQPHAF